MYEFRDTEYKVLYGDPAPRGVKNVDKAHYRLARMLSKPQGGIEFRIEAVRRRTKDRRKPRTHDE